MRVLVCGGRTFNNRDWMWFVLGIVLDEKGVSTLIHGAARGADQLAGMWAAENSIPVEAYPANWARDGKGAGPIRNVEMLAAGEPDLVVAFDGGRGTAHMVKVAEAAGVKVLLASSP